MIHYFPDGDGYIAVDSTQRVRQAPGFLYGRCATQSGDLNTIVERIWSPTQLKGEVPEKNVPDDWVAALGFEATPAPSQRTKRLRQPRQREELPEEGANLLPGKSYLVPLMPLDEYEAWMNRDCDDEGGKRFITDIGFPWETSGGAVSATMLVCFLLIFLCLGVL